MQRAGAMNLLSFLMNDMTEENRKLKLIIFPGETVVIDEYGKRIVACPTEDEAEEYIRERKITKSFIQHMSRGKRVPRLPFTRLNWKWKMC